MGAAADGLRFTVLGPVRALRDGGELNTGTPRQKAVLAVLLLHPGRAVSADQLVDALWGECPPGRPVAAIRTYAWHLRKEIEPDPAEPTVLLRVGSGYRLDVPEEAVDAGRAAGLIAAAARARTA
ncbi:winged helix-turn-helix domain-containing protein, partial [Streptomyces sp. CBMA156]|uniref:AfsR/SARP family transcriptional regulator n=1 Tax=Streptomyces sp. CBMA156 TaxID=1930280 RepID=UPI00166191FC